MPIKQAQSPDWGYCRVFLAETTALTKDFYRKSCRSLALCLHYAAKASKGGQGTLTSKIKLGIL